MMLTTNTSDPLQGKKNPKKTQKKTQKRKPQKKNWLVTIPT